MRTIRTSAKPFLLIFVLTGCPSPQATEPSAGVPEEAAGQSEARTEVESIEMQAREYTFEPSVLRLPSNRQVELTFQNIGTMDHSLVIELPGGEVAFDENVAAGETRTISFTTPDQPGEFVFHCPIEGHRERGMEGRLIVTGPAEQPPVSQR